MKVILTAGYDRARHVLALAELLFRADIKVGGVLVVSPFNIGRLRKLALQRGPGFLSSATRRLAGLNGAPGTDAMTDLCRSERIPGGPLKTWCAAHSVPLLRVNSVNDPKAIEFLSTIRPDWVVYGGGGILGQAFIEAAHGRILNAHSGPLPEIRGMNACEWSLLLGYPPQVTVHLIDRGIDTGPVIAERRIDISPGDTVDVLRSKCVASGVLLLRDVLTGSIEVPSTSRRPEQRQCFVMAPALRELLDRTLLSMTGGRQ